MTSMDVEEIMQGAMETLTIEPRRVRYLVTKNTFTNGVTGEEVEFPVLLIDLTAEISIGATSDGDEIVAEVRQGIRLAMTAGAIREMLENMLEMVDTIADAPENVSSCPVEQ